jgi:predicted ABC-type ATPase
VSAAPRVRVFAGPNGSGKSTLKSVLPETLLGIYINPDEIERSARISGILDPSSYGIFDRPESILPFLTNSSFLREVELAANAQRLRFEDGKLVFRDVEANAYFASVISDFLRQKLLEQKVSFTFETVMSSSDKVAFLEKARRLGYRTYLYFVATDDPDINISRVRLRVRQGGHDVPEGKIVSRYYRSLELLLPAIRHTDRAYIFDNSGHNKDRTWLAEITNGETLQLKTDRIPAWFKRAVLDKLPEDPK